MIKKSILWNVVLFNMAWFGLVFMGDTFIPAALLLLCFYFFFYSAKKSEIQLIFIVAVIGILMDSALVYVGVFSFPNTELIPFWLMTLWIIFASTIRHSLAFMAGSKLLQLFVGTVLAPLSYLAGAKLSVVFLAPSVGFSYLILACLWGPLMLLVFALSRWLEVEEQSNVAHI